MLVPRCQNQSKAPDTFCLSLWTFTSAKRLRFHGIIDRRHPGAGPVFAPTVHGSAWPNGLLGQTLRITAFQCQAFRCAQALHWNIITSFAAVEDKSLRQHRYRGVGKNGFYRPGSINELRPICLSVPSTFSEPVFPPKRVRDVASNGPYFFLNLFSTISPSVFFTGTHSSPR